MPDFRQFRVVDLSKLDNGLEWRGGGASSPRDDEVRRISRELHSFSIYKAVDYSDPWRVSPSYPVTVPGTWDLELLSAVQRADAEEVEDLLATGKINLAYRNEMGDGWIQIAERVNTSDEAGKTQCIKLFMAVCNINQRNYHGENCLCVALVSVCSPDVIRGLLAKGADAYNCYCDMDAVSVLLTRSDSRSCHKAAHLRILLKHFPKLVNEGLIGRDKRPLHLAMERNSPELVRIMLKHPALELEANDRLVSVAILTPRRPSLEIVKIAVEAVKARSDRPLHDELVYRSYYGRMTAIMVLVQTNNVCVDEHEAARIIDYLAEKGCPVDGAEKIDYFPIHRCLDKPLLVKSLLLNGCSVAGTESQSLLLRAASVARWKVETVQTLLNFGCRLRPGEECPARIKDVYDTFKYGSNVPSLLHISKKAFLHSQCLRRPSQHLKKTMEEENLPAELKKYILDF